MVFFGFSVHVLSCLCVDTYMGEICQNDEIFERYLFSNKIFIFFYFVFARKFDRREMMLRNY